MERAASAPAPQARTVYKAGDRWAALGAAVTYAALGLLSRGRPHGLERRLFNAMNHRTPERSALRVPQQLGTPWVPPLLALAGFLTHRPHLAVSAAVAVPLEKALEVGAKKAFDRPRPYQADPEAKLHDDAPTEGGSYPSGHAAIAFTAVLLTRPDLPTPLNALGTLVAAASGWVRVRQGAHFPVDAAGGALLGVLVASALSAVIGRPADPGPLLPVARTS